MIPNWVTYINILANLTPLLLCIYINIFTSLYPLLLLLTIICYYYYCQSVIQYIQYTFYIQKYIYVIQVNEYVKGGFIMRLNKYLGNIFIHLTKLSLLYTLVFLWCIFCKHLGQNATSKVMCIFSVSSIYLYFYWMVEYID